MLICTTFQSDPEAIKARKGVVISSRVHPGETGASWMMKGIIDYITGPSLNAKILRDNFVFKLLPMLNPDGVINGSSRCNLAGVDLNRVWIDPNRKLHPTVYHMKNVSHLTFN
jgi:murein tripeptide amidase MpaA